VDGTALFTAIMGAAYGAMVADRLARGLRWMALGLAAVGITQLANFVTLGKGSVPEHRVIFIASIVLTIFFIVALGAAQRDRERDLGRFLR
jgi:hypothetical protein